MTTRYGEISGREYVPSGPAVVGRFWIGGLAWGPLAGGSVGLLPAVWTLLLDPAGSDGSSWAASRIEEMVTLALVLGSIGVALGAAVGAATGLVAGLLLAGLRGHPHAVSTTTVVTLLVLGSASAVTLHRRLPTLVGLALVICLAALGPLVRTLRRALRAAPQPVQDPRPQ